MSIEERIRIAKDYGYEFIDYETVHVIMWNDILLLECDCITHEELDKAGVPRFDGEIMK